MAGGPDMEVGNKSSQALNVQRLQSRFSLRSTSVAPLHLQGQAGDGGLLATFDAIFQQVTPAATVAESADNKVQSTDSCQEAPCVSDSDEVVPAAEAKPVKDETNTDELQATTSSETLVDIAAEVKLVSDAEIETQAEQVSVESVVGVAETRNELDDDEEHDAAALAIASQQPLATALSASPNDGSVDSDTETPVVDESLSVGVPDSETKRSRANTRSNEANQPGASDSFSPVNGAVPSNDPSVGVEETRPTPEGDAPVQATEPGDSDDTDSPRRTRRAERLMDQAEKRSEKSSDVPAANEVQHADSQAGPRDQGNGKAHVDSQWLGGMQAVEPYELQTGSNEGSSAIATGSTTANILPTTPVVTATVSSGTPTSAVNEFAQQVSDVNSLDGISETDASASSDRSSSNRGPRELSTETGATNASNSTNESRVRLVQRVTRSFQRLGPEGGRVQIMLHPAELGSVRLDLSVDGNRVNATMTADSEAALDVLKENLPELKQRLIESGMVVDRMDVELDQRQSQGDSARFRQDAGQGFASQQERRWNGTGQGTRRSAELTTAKGNVSQVPQYRAPRGRLDLSI